MHNLARSDLGRLRSSAANISETDKDIQNRIVIPVSYTHLTLPTKRIV